MGTVTPTGQGLWVWMVGLEGEDGRWQAGCKGSFRSGNLPFLLTSRMKFGYSQLCNRQQELAALLLSVTDRLLSANPRRSGDAR